MFIDAIIGGISLLRFWQVWAAIAISSLATIFPLLIIGGVFAKNQSFISFIVPTLIEFCSPILDAMVTGLIIMFLMPILFGINPATPFPPLPNLLAYIFAASCVAVVAVLIIGTLIGILIARLTIFFSGKAFYISDNLFSILINLVLFRILIYEYIANNNMVHVVYPGLIEVAILLLASWAFVKLIFVIFAFISVATAGRASFFTDLIIGTINRLLPVFIYAQYIALSSINKVSSLTTPLNIILCFMFIYIIYGISHVFDDFAEPYPSNSARPGYVAEYNLKIAFLMVFLWPISIYLKLNSFYLRLKRDIKELGDTQKTKVVLASSITQDTRANDDKYFEEYNREIDSKFKASPIKILAVDDQIGALECFKEILKIKGIFIKCACDGQEALDVLSKHQFDLLLTDIKMPRMDGIKLLNIIKDKYPNMKRAICSVVYRPLIEKDLEGCHVMEYLPKPFKMGELYALVETAAKGLGIDLGPDFTKILQFFNILCVDSQAGNLGSLKEILKIKNNLLVDTFQTNDVNEAISKINANEYDLIFYQLYPYGLKLLSSIKSHNPNTQVVVYSAYASDETYKEAVKLGALKYLRMPWLMGDIYALVDKAAKQLGKDLGPDFIKHRNNNGG